MFLYTGSKQIPDIAFDLTELFGSVNREAQIKAEGKNVSYAVDWERADLPFICLLGNPVYAARLLTAITDNAVKFTEPGGSVRVWCEKKEIKGKQIVYEFGCEDNGIGMSEEFLPHAFEMFAQEKETSRTGYEGSGLGLTIARELALRLGGNIALTSQKGKGTTVRAELPFRISDREELALCPESKEKENVSLEGRRALLVEDNELNMEIAQFMLESNGILTDEASDGEEAVGGCGKVCSLCSRGLRHDLHGHHDAEDERMGCRTYDSRHAARGCGNGADFCHERQLLRRGYREQQDRRNE